MGKWKSHLPPAPYRHCWECSALLYAGGRVYEVVACDGADRYVHKDCAAEMRAEGRIAA